MSIIVSLALATICFTADGVESCYPALLGKSNATPAGTYTLIKRLTADPGYGGDVLQYYETDKMVYAIHRVWLLKPSEHRAERLKSNKVSERFITNGCINLEPEVYEKLANCCSNDTLVVK